jgi:hypothetical protein
MLALILIKFGVSPTNALIVNIVFDIVCFVLMMYKIFGGAM